MIGRFARNRPTATAALGADTLAQALARGAVVPPSCVGVIFDQGGQTRRVEAGTRIDCGVHEQAACFHPGPYQSDLVPFAAAPELGLRLTFALDRPDPRVARQRFDLFLASEAAEGIALAAFCQLLEAAVQRELAQGNLELPPCTSLDEFDVFRSGLNQLLYTRFGVSVADCVPVDLGAVDYAQLLLARAHASAPNAPAHSAIAEAHPVTPDDAAALRRLFLELPCVTSALRLLVLPPGQALFRQHQGLLHRLAQLNLEIATMPALALAAPGVTLAPKQQRLRALHSVAALATLDEAWALLARLTLAAPADLADALDQAERIVANLELQCAARRLTP
ncbi:hypothetical protein [Massilia sp. CF038]|uniref:hypothetical protein n=1 Tax=Massilia sp. CF038 TaxID=1881045 RepID=UPI0009142C22|nr:hypothetical protein [Massilia sp. CF038]SHG99115.1 hypothetical protein SAMN05428948_2215 [Massilia sp. CF038]